MKILSTTRSVPDPTPLLFAVALALAWVLLSRDPGPAGPWLLGALMAPAACAVMYVLSRHVGAALWALLAAVTLSRFYLELGGMKARPEHILIGLLCVAAIFHWQRRSQPVRWLVADYFLLAYTGLNLLSSLTMSIAPSQTFKWAVQQALVIMAYFLMRILAGEPDTFRRAVRVLVALGALEGAYAILCFYSNFLLGTEFGVAVDQYGTLPGTYGTILEANFLGAICGASLVIALVLYFHERRRRYLLALGFTYAGLVIALSRAAIIASAVAVVVLFFAARKTRLIDWRGFRAAGVALLWASVMLAPAIIPLYMERFSTVEVSDLSADPDTVTRIVTYAVAVEDIAQHPVLGNGTSSFQLLVSNEEMGFGDLGNTGAWVGNLEVRVLHDTGVIGLAALCCFLVYLAVPAWKLLRKEQQPELLALMLSALIYSMTFQATEGTLLAFCWVHLGLIASAISIYYPRNKGLREPLA